MKKRPIIGIPAGRHTGSFILPLFSTSCHYIEQVAEAGGIPVILPILSGASAESLRDLIDGCDGFLLPGGADFDPTWYGEELLPQLLPDSGALDMESQKAALEFLRMADASGKPILGICLGMQVLTVALGGSLYQDIPTQVRTDLTHRNPMKVLSDRWRIAHSVTTSEGSALRSLVGTEIPVNSFHHQAVKQLPAGYHAAAWASDGLLEAAEREDGKVIIVQWHPENLAHAQMPESRALFRWLVDSAEH